MDLEDKSSFLEFYGFLLKNENLKQHYYYENNKFYEKMSKRDELLSTHTSLELYTMLLNEFVTLNKVELIRILEVLAMHNLTNLFLANQEQQNLSSFVMNLRLKA